MLTNSPQRPHHPNPHSAREGPSHAKTTRAHCALPHTHLEDARACGGSARSCMRRRRAAAYLRAALDVEGRDGGLARRVGHHLRLCEVGALDVEDALVRVRARLELGNADARA
eukprot:4922167-Prymnesium_polylepis.1